MSHVPLTRGRNQVRSLIRAASNAWMMPPGHHRISTMTSTPKMIGWKCGRLVERTSLTMLITTAPRTGPATVPNPPNIAMTSMSNETARSNAM